MRTPLIAIALLGIACRSAAQQAAPMITDSAFVPTGIEASQLPDSQSEGAQLVARYCSQCHGIPSPASHAAEDWPATLRRMLMHMERVSHMPGMGGMMRGRMGTRGMGGMGMMHAEAPAPAEQQAILAYLESHGLQAIAPDRLPAAAGAGAAGAARFARTCNRCHALPNPAQHTAADWPAVVRRMRDNMLRFKVDTISDQTAAAIVRYLQSAVSGG
jgi:mono/diheme cytochrome c family protein